MKKITDYAELVKAKHALNKTIAPVEDGANIAGSYTSGKQFIREGVLYTALTTIPTNTAWSSLTLDTDYELADDLTSQLASLKQTLTNNLANEVVTRAKLGGHNLLPNYAVSLTNYSVDFTVNSDGSITADGTATGGNAQILWRIKKSDLSSGRYILSKTTAASGDHFYLNASNGNTFVKQLASIGGSTTESAAFDVDWDGYDKISVGYYFDQNTVVDNVTIYPMIRLATDADTTYQPYSMTNQELTPIAQAVSNRNLLDNPWFTVNQRGQNSYSGNVYGYDRWIGNSNSSVESDSNGVKIIDTLWQRFESDFITKISGKSVTLSVLLGDGTIYSASGIASSANGTFIIINNDVLDARFIKDNYFTFVHIHPKDSSGLVIRAVKLELGTVSTLAQDTAPNYAEELLKCQRYFVAIPISESIARINQNITFIRVQGIYTNNLRSPVSSVTTSATGVNVSGNGTQVNLAYESDFTLAFEPGQGVRLNLTTAGSAKLPDMGNQLVGLWDYQNKIYVSADL